MAIVRIPEAGKRFLQALSHLPDSDFAQLVDALNRLPDTFNDDALVSFLQSEGPKGLPNDALGHVLSMSRLVAKRNRPTGDVISEMTAEARRGIHEDLANLDHRLLTLINIAGLALMARVHEVQQENANIWMDCRILSDIRPIFDVACEKSEAAVIVHTLKIDYYSDGESKELFLSITPEDLNNLKTVIERSEKKQIVLESIINKSGTKYYA